MDEIWKPIDGFEYEVSNLGRVRNKKGYIKKEHINKLGYCKIGLWKSGKVLVFSIHRLVAKAFIGEIYEEVDHINEVKSDNRLVNLRLCTKRENQLFKTNQEYAGTYYHKKAKKWASVISVHNKNKHLGLFKSREDASKRYWQEVEKLESEKSNDQRNRNNTRWHSGQGGTEAKNVKFVNVVICN